ncbi:hypothetical protein N7485_003631 [Penicillium canescens]|nr:hypothetical protein N7485_003631 [Penicillium canescens]
MVAPGSQWPALSGGLRENSANQNTTDRVIAANHDVQRLLEHVDKGGKVPPVVLEYLKVIRELTVDLLKNPLSVEWRRELAEMKRETIMEIRKEMHAVRIATAASKTESGPRVRSYVEGLKRAPGPAHFLSAHGSTSTPGVAPSELSRDRDIIVKLGDADGIVHFRSMKSSEIKDRAGKARTRAATVSPVLAAIQFVAARQLKFGDVSLTLRSAKDAEAARVHRGKWVQHLWKDAEVRLPSWGVVVHDVNVKSLGINRPAELKERQEAVSKQLLTQNLHSWGNAEITHLAWLILPEGKKSGSMIVEFSSPYVANKAIDCNTIWDSTVLTTVLYDRAARIRQCHRCQQYGHIGRTCSANSPKCVYCAGDHLSPDCRGKQDATLIERKCANCGGAHAAWSRSCKVHQAEIDRVQELEIRRERYHRIPAYLSISDPAPRMAGSSSSGSGISREPVSLDPTPREATSMGSGRGTANTATSRSQQASNQRTNSTKSKPATAAAKKTASKPASVATGGNATSLRTRSTGPASEASILMTPNNMQPTAVDADMDTSEDVGRPTNATSFHQSMHAPINFQPSRSEPVKTRSKTAASQASTVSSAALARTTRTIREIKPLRTAEKRQKTTTAATEDSEDELSWNPPSSTSALTELDSNGSVARKATTAPGKENRPIFDMPGRITRGVNKRTHSESFPVNTNFTKQGGVSQRLITDGSDVDAELTNNASNE